MIGGMDSLPCQSLLDAGPAGKAGHDCPGDAELVVSVPGAEERFYVCRRCYDAITTHAWDPAGPESIRLVSVTGGWYVDHRRPRLAAVATTAAYPSVAGSGSV